MSSPVSASDSRAATWARFPLVALLAVVAGAELLINRIAGHLVEIDPLMTRTLGRRIFIDSRIFVYELTAILSVMILGSALARITASKLYRIGARVSFTMIGFVCVIMASLGAAAELPADVYFDLQLSFAFMFLLATMTLIAARTTWRLRLGAFVLFLPPALHFAARLVRRLTPVPELTSTPLELEALAQATLAAASVIAVPCFASRRHGRRLGIAIAAALVGAAAVLIRADWETAARVAAYGFGVALPMQSWAILVYLLAFGAFAYTVVTLISSTGPERLRGYGLLLYGLAGLDYQAPFQMALSGLGFLCLLESVVRPTEPPMAREAFENLVRRAAAAVGAPQVTLTGNSGYETARVHSPASEALPVAVTLTRAAGQVTLVDVVVGERVPRDPPFTLERRDAGKLGPRAEGTAIETGEPKFDAAFATRDRRGLNAQLLDDATRARLHDACRGWIGVWPQRGVRYRAESLAAGDDALPGLIALLRELATRAA